MRRRLAASWHAGSSLPVHARIAALVKLFLSGSGIQEGSRLSCVDTQLEVRG